MPTNKQRRDANRVRLERQLEARRESEARRRKITLITSIGATVVLIAAIVIVIVAVNSGNDTPAAGGKVDCTKPYTGKSVTFEGVTVTNAAQLGCQPKVKSAGTTDPTKLLAKDLVVGTGKAATPTSAVKVQYEGVLYKKGTEFDASWKSGSAPVSFSLTGVVAGFTQGIGGTTGLAPMKVGGRRLLVLPASLGYGTKGQGSIPANASLVFVVDLAAVTS